VFDPSTGQLDTVKTGLIRVRTRSELRSRFNADAWLHPSFLVRKAPFDRGVARWDGVSQLLRGKGVLGWLAAAQKQGTVGALSLVVSIEDMSGNTLYVSAGGLQVLTTLGGKEGFTDVPEDSLFVDPQRNLEAVRVALEALVKP